MDKNLKKIHILGIAGAMTAPLARALIGQGYLVSGSDQEKIYPPFSDLIAEIPINQPLGDIDLAIVGSSYKSFQICQQEFEQIKKKGVPYISATQYIATNLIKTESIMVAGSYGKTTITALLAWLIPDVNYFFGGSAVNNFPSLNFSDSSWSIVEGDESINGLDTQAKFLYYPVKYLILTSASWEHKDSYPTSQANFQAYKDLVQKLPKDGLLVYNPSDPDITNLLSFCQARQIPYGQYQFDTPLIGRHNQDNINAALTLCEHLDLGTNHSLVSTFTGIHRRLEIISLHQNTIVIDDFGQSATRVKSAIQAIQSTYPHRTIKIYFEPHASFLQNIDSVAEFSQIAPLVDLFVLAKLKFSKNKTDRVTVKQWQHIFTDKLRYFPIDLELINFLRSTIKPGDILVHFSSGGLDGLLDLKKVYNN